ncbi:MAG: hypothetical protein U9Q74_11610, partial [Gemmatimonadota bacterium]|nr:hypothetical protein [Gemmatimonadota bacterium]
MEEASDGAIIRLHPNQPTLLEVLPQPGKIAIIRAAKSIDGLIRIADHEEIPAVSGEELHEAVLQ